MTAPALVGVQLAPAEQLRAVLAQLLQALRRWTVWRARSKTVADGTTKIDKVPTARTNDPTTWLTLDQALAEAPPPGAGGIGFILTTRPAWRPAACGRWT
ncbi:MAG: hypothetical protein IPO09_09045 [Anaeromyxobacter sp.]|nr:hypothetical protein [Anaeromyxobacter sp.]